MEWLIQNAKQSAGGVHHALKAVEKDVPKKARVPFASLLTLLLQVIAAVDALLDALRSNDDDDEERRPPPPPPRTPEGADDEAETPDRDTPPRR